MLLHVGDTMDPDEFNIPKVPYYWVGPATNTPREPNFDLVDNPGRWSSLSHQPIFAYVAKGIQ